MDNFRTVFISDIHLGTRGCAADELLAFLTTMQCQTLYLVGDIIDVWALKSNFYWPKSHMDILQKFLDLANSGTTVKFIPGNHDELFRDLIGLRLTKIEILFEDVFVRKDGKRYLVLHGDKHDIFHIHFKWISKVCTRFQNRSERMSTFLNPHMGVSKKIKSTVKSFARYINKFEKSIVLEAKTKGYDGVICGHFHAPAHKVITDIDYYNDGDWVQNRTALVEDLEGNLRLLDCHPFAQKRAKAKR